MTESAMAGRVSEADAARVAGVFAPAHLGELTQIIDTELVDAVAAETGTVQKRVRLLPTRVVIFFVLALALFSDCGYRLVWSKLVAGLERSGLGSLAVVSVSGLCRARVRVGPKPFRALFEAVSGPVGYAGMAGVFGRGLRLVAFDGTYLRVPDAAAVRAVLRKREGPRLAFGYPLLRLSVLIECGTKALLAAAFGPDTAGETVYAQRLLGALRPGMLLLADAYYDSYTLLAQVSQTGADWLVRSGAARSPLIERVLPDGSYLSVLHGRGQGQRLPVRVIEAQVQTRLADGTVTTHQWRLITSLLDWRRFPADELISVYHERWEAETCYRSLKCTLLHGRVLRSRRPDEITQEVWALLAVYQAIVRMAVDALPVTGPDPDRISFTVAWQTACDQVVLAAGICPADPRPQSSTIARAVLANLLPPRRLRVKARTKKLARSQYSPAGTGHPKTTIGYTIHTQITIFEEGLTARSSP